MISIVESIDYNYKFILLLAHQELYIWSACGKFTILKKLFFMPHNAKNKLLVLD